MSDRDELARDIEANPPYHCVDCLSDKIDPLTDRVDVDALWSAGWRKKPDRLALTMFMRAVSPVVHEPLATDAAEKWADAVLALLDGPTETGEK